MNKKGFTLIELLATIIILGLLVTITYISARGILDRGNDSYYKNQENMLVLAGREYFADHRNELPKEISETATVTLETLIKEKYIDPIKDKDGEDCDAANSGVTAQKITTKDYQYYGLLACTNGGYKTEEDEAAPVITFTPNKEDSLKPITVTMKVKDNEEVKSYRYVIEKDGEEYKDSGYQNYSGNITINLTELGTYKITGYAIDSSGNTASKRSGTYTIYKGVNCSNVEIKSDFKAKTWTNKNITLSITFPSEVYRWEFYTKIDDGPYELTQGYIGSMKNTIVLSNNGKNQIKIISYDRDGNPCTTISDEYYIDKVGPKCVSSGGSSEWTSGPVTIKGTCDDEESGCVDDVSKTFSGDTDTTTASPGTVYDKVGNSTVCPADQTVKIDKTPPSCGSTTGENTTWTKYNRTISVACSDQESGCTSSSFSKTFSEEGRTDEIIIADKMGNTRSCTVNKYIDKTAPEYIRAYTEYRPSWANSSVFGWVIIDKISGINGNTSMWEYCYEGQNSTRCGATCYKGNAWSHKPSSIVGTQSNYYFQDVDYIGVDSGVQAVAEAGVNTSCVTGHRIRTNMILCDYAGNCAIKANFLFSFK